MATASDNRQGQRPALLCYDGSNFARGAVEHAGAVLGGGPAIVLTVWESVASALFRHTGSARTEVGSDVRAMSQAVIDELDIGTAERAQETAAEGLAIARGAGFDARELARRAIGRAAERTERTVWEAVLDTANEEDAGVIVLGSRGLSGFKASLLGSVSYGVVHNGARPVMIVPSSPR